MKNTGHVELIYMQVSASCKIKEVLNNPAVPDGIPLLSA